jgi:hypothetical protein
LRITDFLQFPLKKLSRIAAASAMLVIPVTLPIRLQRQPPQLPISDPGDAETLKQASQELTAATGSERNVAKIWKNTASFEFSPALRPKLKEMFGAERPFPITRTDGPKARSITSASWRLTCTYKAMARTSAGPR